jgi:hypothetical protein
MAYCVECALTNAANLSAESPIARKSANTVASSPPVNSLYERSECDFRMLRYARSGNVTSRSSVALHDAR